MLIGLWAGVASHLLDDNDPQPGARKPLAVHVVAVLWEAAVRLLALQEVHLSCRACRSGT